MSKAQFAALLEKKHLVECEEHDYMILQDLFQERSVDTDDSTEVTIVIWYIYTQLLFLQGRRRKFGKLS